MESQRNTGVLFKSGKLLLEGVVSSPLDGGGGSSPGVVVCHPHPRMGGDMDNPVVTSIARALTDEGIHALRFNFRGVGESQGSHDGGRGESDDLKAAVDFLSHWPGVDRRSMGAAGYSFGAQVTLSWLGRRGKARAFALVSPPGDSPDAALRLRRGVRALFLVGARDPAAKSLRERVGHLNGAVQTLAIDGADHFWRGREVEAARAVSRFFSEVLV